MSFSRDSELKVLSMLLKSGEYDGTHIMQAWIAIDELIEQRALALEARAIIKRYIDSVDE